MNSERKLWNEQQQKLRKALESPGGHQKAVELFLSQHAMVHAAGMAQTGDWSFEDEVLNGVTEDAFRRVPSGGEHSIAWCIFHAIRCEDITMNLLVSGRPQILNQDNWSERMRITIRHSGNEMSDDEVVSLSNAIDFEALREYRLAVGRKTREIVTGLKPEELKEKVEPERIQRIWNEGAAVKAAGYIVDYWAKRTKAGLLLMPPTRHNFVHLNEALRIKQKLR